MNKLKIYFNESEWKDLRDANGNLKGKGIVTATITFIEPMTEIEYLKLAIIKEANIIEVDKGEDTNE